MTIFHQLATHMGDHLGAAVHNLQPQRSELPMLDQSAFSEALSNEQALALHAYARKLWSGALQKFLAAATVAEQRSQNAALQDHRVRFGAYFYAQGPAPSAPPPGARTATEQGGTA